MKLRLHWLPPLTLEAPSSQLGYELSSDKVPDTSGVYVFGRRFGRKFEALYVGKAEDLNFRTKLQLNNLKLIPHLKNAKTGKRILLVGQFAPRPGQQEDKCLRILERALIRYFLSEGHDLVNKQGARLRRHEVASNGSNRNVPGLIFVDRGRAE